MHIAQHWKSSEAAGEAGGDGHILQAIQIWSADTATRVSPPMISISTQTRYFGAIASIVPTKSAKGPKVRGTWSPGS